MFSRVRILALVWVCGCGGPEPEHILWSADAQSLDNPFPDSRLLTPEGLVMRPDYYRPFVMRKGLTKGLRELFATYSEEAKTQVSGLGNFGPTLLRTSAGVDPQTLAGHFHRLRKTSDGYVVLEKNVVAEHVSQTLVDTGVTPTAEFPEFTLVRASVPLPEGEEGALVVTRGIKTKTGELLGRGREWHAQRPDLKPLAGALGLPEDDILLVLPLRAENVSTLYRDWKSYIDSPAGLPPVTIPAKGVIDEPGHGTRPVGVWKSSDADWSRLLRWLERNGWARPVTHVERVVLGEIAAKDPREKGAWRSDWTSEPASAPVVPLRFVLTVPSGQKPPGGWPTIIGAHGLGGRNVPVDSDGDSFCLEMGELLATAGLACIGIDAPSHGMRGNLIGFLDVQHVKVMRENFRQMTLDLMQLARAVPTVDVDADSVPDLAAELGFFGNSLGAIMGASYVALDDRVKYAALNVPGGGLSNILVSTDIRDRLGLLLVASTSLTFNTEEYFSTFPLIRAVAQPFLESADPVNLARLMGSDRALLVQIGVGDLTIPNFTSEDLRRSAGLPELTAPVSGGGPVRDFYQVKPSDFLPPSQWPGYNGHNVFNDVPFARRQVVDFLRSKGTTLTLP